MVAWAPMLYDIFPNPSQERHEEEGDMTIGAARQRDQAIFVYDREGIVVAILDARDGLVGFTDSRVTLRSGSFLIDCDESGREVEVRAHPTALSRG